jgi:hypothetical protein
MPYDSKIAFKAVVRRSNSSAISCIGTAQRIILLEFCRLALVDSIIEVRQYCFNKWYRPERSRMQVCLDVASKMPEFAYAEDATANSGEMHTAQPHQYRRIRPRCKAFIASC